MPGKTQFSFKRLQIDKATSTMIIFISLATAIFVFTLVATRALLSQRAYYSKVIGMKETAKKQLADNIKSKNALVSSYQSFVDQQQNIIGRSSTGTGDGQGDNAKIILNALPSKYDFPALTTSLEKLLTYDNLSVSLEGVTGTDDEIAQAAAEVEEPAPVEIPFQLDVRGTYPNIQKLVNILERSIRPMRIKSLSFTGSDNDLRLSVNALTYYQPDKKVNIREQVVK